MSEEQTPGEVQADKPHAVRSADEAPADTRRGGDVRTLLSPKTVGSTSGLHGRGHDRAGRPDRASTTTRTPRSSSTCVRGHAHRRARRRAARRCRRGEGLFIPINVRTACATTGDEEALIVFHLGPLAPRPELGHVDTEEPQPCEAHERSVVTGVGVVAPGGVDARRVLGPHHRRPDGDPPDHLLRPVGFRSQIAAECDFDPLAAGLTDQEIAPHGPLRPVRGRRRRRRRSRDSGLDLEAVDRERIGGHARQRRRRHDGLEDGLRRRLQPRRGVARRPRVRAARSSTRRSCPSSLASEVALEVRRPGAGVGRLHRLHLRPRRGRLRPPADPGRRGRHRDRRRLRLADLADLGGLLRRDQGDLARATTTPSTPRGRSTATATAS